MKLKIIAFNQKGAAAVEFAIILPILITLLFGIIEFGILLYDKAMITNASREGARAGIVLSQPKISDEKIKAVVNNYCSNHLITFGEDFTIKPVITITKTGNNLIVNVKYAYEFLVIPNFVTDIAGTMNLAAETTMRME